MTREKFYIATAIDYANGIPHVGTAYEKIGADAIARWKRMQGFDVLFLMGMDEHSMNVERKAVSLGKEPLAYCDGMEQKFREVWKRLNISFDDFIRTTETRHIASVNEFFKRVHAKGDIYKAKYSGLYCVSCEAYLKPGDLRDGKCPNHGTVPQTIEEENWFFRLSKYTEAVKEHIEKNPQFVQPDVRRNEVLNVVRDGLEDISISRGTFKFGIPIPVDPSQVIYVWFDALINYISAIGYPDGDAFKKWWPCDLHIIGKDITRFHCALWPAMLMSAGVALPKQVWGHGWVHYKGQKQSKSTGNLVDPLDVAKQYGPDALRYFLLREVPWDRDGDFTWEAFTTRYNSDLANDLGNLLHRTLNMLHRYQKGILAPATEAGTAVDGDLRTNVGALPADVAACMDRYEFHNALVRIWNAVGRTNTYIEENAPWTLNKKGETGRLGAVLTNVASALAMISTYLTPFVPETAKRIREQLGLPADPGPLPTGWTSLPAGHAVREGVVLFPKIETEAEK